MNLTGKLKKEVFEKTNGHCAYCGFKLEPFTGWQIDHIIPKYYGGRDILINLFPACKLCNNWKSNHYIKEFEEIMFFKTIELNRKNRDYPYIVNFTLTQIEHLFWSGFYDILPKRKNIKYEFYFEKLNLKIPHEIFSYETYDLEYDDKGNIIYEMKYYERICYE